MFLKKGLCTSLFKKGGAETVIQQILQIPFCDIDLVSYPMLQLQSLKAHSLGLSHSSKKGEDPFRDYRSDFILKYDEQK